MLIEMDYENIKKYFTYSGGKIRPYNSKILPYISNLQRWLDSGNNTMVYCFFNFDFLDVNHSNIDFILEKTDVFFFEFDNEEESFYFKMKYC